MYLRILKKDLRRKKTMNVILLIFVILAATFIASSANNFITVTRAVDNFFDKAGVPDYWFGSINDIERFEKLAEENGYEYYISRLVQIEPKGVFVEGEKLTYSQTLTLSTLGGIKIFDKNNEEITRINDGEIYVTSTIFQSAGNDFHEGGKIRIKQGNVEKEFTLKGYTKDALFGSAMVGITRFLVSENDIRLFEAENLPVCSSVEVCTQDADYLDKFNELGIDTVLMADKSMAKMLYFIDMLVAAVLLVVSVCLILISMVILRFIINFTITEEYREIGVMKAIGIKNGAIRRLYIMKYLAISSVGTAVGLVLSVPFGRLLLNTVSKKIIISGEDSLFINIGAAALAGIAVVLFSYLCTRKICRFSPIDAIRNGETGERFKKKGILHLGSSRIAVVPFMALNDILGGMKSYISMILIFILGTLLVIIPVNTVNTLCSDNLITLFNMVESDHILVSELLFDPRGDNAVKVDRQLSEVRELFAENGIAVEVFQEVMFRSIVSKGDRRTNSLSFQGRGGVTTEEYVYIEGTPPQNVHEVALSHITAAAVGAEIGDDVKIKIGETERTYLVTALLQSMSNMGEGVRFHQDAELDYSHAAGSFGIQVNYKDNPDERALTEREELLKKQYPDTRIFCPGEYIQYMIGDVAEQVDNIKMLILTIILGINILVAVLMVRSFITREKREIALLKAIGFRNNPLVFIQTLRIGMVLLASVITGVLLSTPLSNLIVTPVFRMMGAYRITFEIRAAEVYVVFPAIMLAATAFSAFLSAQGLRKISSSEISNIE